MGLKEILDMLASIPEEQLSKEDKAMLADLAGKYAGAPAPESKMPKAEEAKPQLPPAQTNKMPEAKAESMPAPKPDAPVEAAKNTPAPGPEAMMKELEAVAQPEMPAPQSQDMMGGIQQEISSLRESIESIKKMLESVAIREPISEEEAEKEEKPVGQKGKPGKTVEAEPNMTEMLMKKLGG
jgi:hypothetical protein